MNKRSVMVFVEQNDSRIADVSLELICKAKTLADRLHVAVTTIVCGHDLQDKLPVLGHYGADEVFYDDDERLSRFTSLPYAKVLVKLIGKYEPQIVLFGATANGRDLAPRIASVLNCGLTADCTDLQIGDYEFKGKKWKDILLQIRPAFAGNIIATIVSPESIPSMSTVREGVMPLMPPDTSRSIKITAETCDLYASDFPSEILEVVKQERSVDLKNARIIVSVGMGVTTQESLTLVKDLAHKLGAEIGCTRPVVDAGLLSKEHQIGQTGIAVHPILYIACGISGQIQHTIGIKDAHRIIAINNDASAPIFKIAHYSIIGDLNDIIAKMIKKCH